MHASHCSCYGFEGQWGLEAVTPEYLQSEKHYLPTGGYDEAADTHTQQVREVLTAVAP